MLQLQCFFQQRHPTASSAALRAAARSPRFLTRSRNGFVAQRQRGEDGEAGTSPNPRLLRVSPVPVRLAGCTYSLWKGLLKKKISKSILTSRQQHFQLLNIFLKWPGMQRRPPTRRYVCIKGLWNTLSTLTACIKLPPYSSVRKAGKKRGFKWPEMKRKGLCLLFNAKAQQVSLLCQ